MIVRQSAIYMAGRMIPAAINFVALGVYTRLLLPDEFGAYILVSSSVMLVHTMALLWLCSAALRLDSTAEDNIGFLTSLAVAFGGILLLLAVVSLPVMFLLTPQQQLLYGLGFLLLGFLSWFELNLALVSSRLEAGRFAWLNLVRAGASTLLGVSFALMGWSTAGILLGTILGYAIPGFWIARQVWQGIALRRLEIRQFREIGGYGLPLAISFALYGAARQSDRLPLGHLRGEYDVGLYGAGFELADKTIMALAAPIGTATFPLAMHELEKNGLEAARVQLRQNFTLLLGLMLPATAGLITIGPELVSLAIGPAYRETATTLLPLIAIATCAAALRGFYFDYAFQLGRKTRDFVIVTFIILLLALGLNVGLAAQYGALGTAYAMLIMHIAGLSLSIVFGRRALPLPIPILESLKITGATALMVLAITAVPEDTAIRSLIEEILVGVVVFAIAAIALDVSGLRRRSLSLLARKTARQAGNGKNEVAGNAPRSAGPAQPELGPSL